MEGVLTAERTWLATDRAIEVRRADPPGETGGPKHRATEVRPAETPGETLKNLEFGQL